MSFYYPWRPKHHSEAECLEEKTLCIPCLALRPGSSEKTPVLPVRKAGQVRTELSSHLTCLVGSRSSNHLAGDSHLALDFRRCCEGVGPDGSRPFLLSFLLVKIKSAQNCDKSLESPGILPQMESNYGTPPGFFPFP